MNSEASNHSIFPPFMPYKTICCMDQKWWQPPNANEAGGGGLRKRFEIGSCSSNVLQLTHIATAPCASCMVREPTHPRLRSHTIHNTIDHFLPSQVLPNRILDHRDPTKMLFCPNLLNINRKLLQAPMYLVTTQSLCKKICIQLPTLTLVYCKNISLFLSKCILPKNGSPGSRDSANYFGFSAKF